MDHPTEIPGFTSINAAAEYICNMRYDALHDFFRHCQTKLFEASADDHDRGRPKLSTALFAAGESVDAASVAIMRAWKISQPHMEIDKPDRVG